MYDTNLIFLNLDLFEYGVSFIRPFLDLDTKNKIIYVSRHGENLKRLFTFYSRIGKDFILLLNEDDIDKEGASFHCKNIFLLEFIAIKFSYLFSGSYSFIFFENAFKYFYDKEFFHLPKICEDFYGHAECFLFMGTSVKTTHALQEKLQLICLIHQIFIFTSYEKETGKSKMDFDSYYMEFNLFILLIFIRLFPFFHRHTFRIWFSGSKNLLESFFIKKLLKNCTYLGASTLSIEKLIMYKWTVIDHFSLCLYFSFNKNVQGAPFYDCDACVRLES